MRKLSLSLLAAVAMAPAAWAHPPTSIEIEYVKEEGKLYVIMGHLSRDHRKHYIRKTAVLLNGSEVAIELNRQQVDPNNYGFAIDIKAKENDEIVVKAYSSEGGVGTASTVVPADGQKLEQAGAVKAKYEAYQNKDLAAEVYEAVPAASDGEKAVY